MRYRYLGNAYIDPPLIIERGWREGASDVGNTAPSVLVVFGNYHGPDTRPLATGVSVRFVDTPQPPTKASGLHGGS